MRVDLGSSLSFANDVDVYVMSMYVNRVVLRWNCAKVIANIDDLAISIWTLKVIDKLSQIDDI